MSRAGERDTLITFMRDGAPVDDGYTTLPGAPASIGQVKARVFYGTGSEQREMASQENAVQAVTFQVPSSVLTREVKVTDQIVEVANGNSWDIEGIAPRRRRSIEMTARRSV